MTFRVRVPHPSEATEIADMHVQTWREAYAHLLPADFFDDDYLQGRRRMWNGILQNPDADWSIRIADEGGRIIGLAVAGPSTPAGDEEPPRARQLYMLYVLAESHGRGVGQVLMDEVLGDVPAVLWVAKENPRAIAFYRRNGFAFDGVEQTYPGVPTLVDARMVR